MSAGLAPGEIIIATGSPGTTRRSTNTTIATPASVRTAMAARLTTTVMTDLRKHQKRPPLQRPIGGGGRSGSYDAFVTKVGCSPPETLGVTLRSALNRIGWVYCSR